MIIIVEKGNQKEIKKLKPDITNIKKAGNLGPQK